jgi:hypothetical protein
MPTDDPRATITSDISGGGCADAVARRTVLAGAPGAALGVSALLLPAAASAASPGAQGTGSAFGIIASSSYTNLDASGAVLFRSFTYGTNRYFVDLVNGKLIAFGATGAHIETLPIDGAPVGFSDPFNQDSADTRAITPFVVVGDAAYAAYLQERTDDPGDLAAFDLKVLRLTLDVEGGETTVTAATKTTDLNALWSARFPTLAANDQRTLDPYRPSPLVAEGTSALHMLLSSEITFYDYDEDTTTITTITRYLDRFVIPIGAGWATAVGAPDLLDSDTDGAAFSLGHTLDGVAVPPSNPTHALFFDEETSDGVLVPFSRVSPDWSSRELSVPEGIGTISSIDQLGGQDRTMATDGNILYAAGRVTAATGQVAMLRFDLSAITLPEETELTVTSAVVVPNSVGGPTALSREGSTVYIAIQNGFDYGDPTSPSFRADGFVARFQTDPPSWLSTATVGISADPPWHYPLTVQAVSTGVLSGGVGGATVGDQGSAAAPLVVLVGGST